MRTLSVILALALARQPAMPIEVLFWLEGDQFLEKAETALGAVGSLIRM